VRVLVTGGAGFIGHHLVRRLLADGDEVRVLDNMATGRRDRLDGLDIEFVEGDLRSYERVHTAVRGVETVYHLGALPSVPRSIQDPQTSSAVNVEGTLNVLLASRDESVRRVVFASSSSVYGANPALPKTEQDLPLPLSPYAVSKLAAEQYCRAFHAAYGLETVALRLFNVFGPGQDPRSQYAAVVPRFIDTLRREQPPTIYGDGEQSRDFTYVEDVVDGFVRAGDAEGAAGLVFNLAAGGRTSVNELVRIISGLLGTSVEPVFAPRREGDVRHSQGSGREAARVLAWETAWSLEDGLARCVESFEDADRLPVSLHDRPR
jgi:UDP-glucose 4-epimerase